MSDYERAAPEFSIDATIETPRTDGVLPGVTAALAREAEAYLRENPGATFAALRLTMIPLREARS